MINPTAILGAADRLVNTGLKGSLFPDQPERIRGFFAYSTKGAASVIISLPLKYKHSMVETVNKDDVRNVITLIYEVLLPVKSGARFRYIM